MNTPVAGPTTTRYPVTGTPLTTTQTTASNSGYPPAPGFALFFDEAVDSRYLRQGPDSAW
ncbi:hypothetical protein [Nesterenkonia flava]|uniref:hypothetical protein n=1 Tax=Nesterenkonia flava TaxID=469799 RepID=UPI0031E01640